MNWQTHTIRVEQIPAGEDFDYLACCSCGWEAIQTVDRFAASTTRCAVLEAEEEGRQRRLRRFVRQHAA